MTTDFSWPALLDSLEEQLRRQEAALRGETDAPGNLALSLLGRPIPPELVPRALSLLDWCRALEQRAGEQVSRRRPPARAYGGPGQRDLGAL